MLERNTWKYLTVSKYMSFKKSLKKLPQTIR